MYNIHLNLIVADAPFITIPVMSTTKMFLYWKLHCILIGISARRYVSMFAISTRTHRTQQFLPSKDGAGWNRMKQTGSDTHHHPNCSTRGGKTCIVCCCFSDKEQVLRGFGTVGCDTELWFPQDTLVLSLNPITWCPTTPRLWRKITPPDLAACCFYSRHTRWAPIAWHLSSEFREYGARKKCRRPFSRFSCRFSRLEGHPFGRAHILVLIILEMTSRCFILCGVRVPKASASHQRVVHVHFDAPSICCRGARVFHTTEWISPLSRHECMCYHIHPHELLCDIC